MYENLKSNILNYLERSRYSRVKFPKAKKIHVCDWCNEKILVGELYFRYVNFDGGQVITTKEHIECASANAELTRESDSNCEIWLDGSHAKGRCDDDCGQPPCFDKFGNKIACSVELGF